MKQFFSLIDLGTVADADVIDFKTVRVRFPISNVLLRDTQSYERRVRARVCKYVYDSWDFLFCIIPTLVIEFN